MIAVTFACGHRFTIEPGVETAPICPTCQEHRVSRTIAPPPRFAGACSGPSAKTTALAGIPVAIPKEQ